MASTPYKIGSVFLVVGGLLLAEIESSADHELSNPFFAYELGDKTPGQQAKLVSDVGFAGTAFDGAVHIPERLKAVDEAHIQLFFIWLTVDVGNARIVYESGMEQAINELKGRGTVVWLAVKGTGPGAEERAVTAAARVADLASTANLRVALYPHYGFYLATLNDTLRIAQKAQRSNLGVTFNLCHELRAGLDPNLPSVIKAALPRLYGVTLNGADHNGHDWNTLIQPLGLGDFDVAGVLRMLIQTGYRGPIGLQCYGITEDPAIHLRQSMKAWREMSSHIAEQ
ncbi:MAG: sugar phosphate isomerase/epimerase [Acidobacteriaceae bacterium]|nr:sugar phosphate isomerase/epimerase [Acidobacteriaceae bacterium]